ncbi:FlhC family transcriptional regulator [Thiorhodovibrio frisius]|uniref:Flagellar transcriptional activator (FlhC) n=1 Tax=Thiorhodovibrio frisius TaxID=631362 RepID=H8YW40_9GAMM|nr:FlhC family transcriptional regulator [Thiorhodovibrio frisius]EIC23831.1 Flagellar transcriptional activator (FlhC) [Thiorhodovibrio frisius]
MILERHARMRLAMELIARRARVSIVHHEAGVPRDTLRALYRELHGVSAPSGQLPTIGGTTINSRRRQLQASLFAVTYLRCRGQAAAEQASGISEASIYTIIAAHDVCRTLAGAENSLDITRCWVTARDLHIGTAKLLGCRACEVHFLVAEQSRFDRTCPICSLYRNYNEAPAVTGEAAGNAFAQSLQLPPEPMFQRWSGGLA